eukprot:5949900-Alexandrium_andersonii.AAC.1
MCGAYQSVAASPAPPKIRPPPGALSRRCLANGPTRTPEDIAFTFEQDFRKAIDDHVFYEYPAASGPARRVPIALMARTQLLRFRAE